MLEISEAGLRRSSLIETRELRRTHRGPAVRKREQAVKGQFLIRKPGRCQKTRSRKSPSI